MPKLNFKSLIIFEDDDYLVINKPPQIASLEDRSSPLNIQKLAKEYHEGAILCHRLDKETSGCLLIAKSEEAYQTASIAFENRKVVKTYHAVVEGLHEWKVKIVDEPLQIMSNGKVNVSFKGKSSKTTFNSLKLFKKHSLIECLPETGRMHQIRVHLAKEQAPIINDEMYGGRLFYLSEIKKNYKTGKYEEERPLIRRFALHAYALKLKGLNNSIEAKAEYPKDLKVLLKQLEANL